MTAFRTLDALDAKGRRVLVRVDFNVPMQDGEITDVTRIERGLPTIRELADKGARVVVLAHFGRPKGVAEPSMSLKAVASAVGEALGQDVAFASDCIGPVAAGAVQELQPGGVLVLENLRFHAGEEKNDPAFAQALADLGDVYVNDAFSCSHRAHASVVGVAERLPAFAGRLLQAEIEALDEALGGAARPAAALIGGSKVSTKLDVLGLILDKVDIVVIGGGMANTFLHAKGQPIGKSLAEKEMAPKAREIMGKAKAKGVEIVLPVDAMVAREFKPNPETRICAIDEVEDDEMILDIGPHSAEAVARRLEEARTLLWNGPMGAFEVPPFDEGTNRVARAAADLTEAKGLKTVAGGGDTVAALVHAGVLERFSYVSTAGGAFLEYLEGKVLPGIAALESD